MGGSKDSALIVTVCRALADRGVASLRFDFRVRTEAEVLEQSSAEDVVAAFDLLSRWRDARPKRCAVAGYSCGAGAIARAAENLPGANAFALIAPPASSIDDSLLMTDGRPALIAAAENDQIVSAGTLRELASRMKEPTDFVLMENTDHFFTGRMNEVADSVSEFLHRALT
jgi:hypothetical protein